MLFRWVIWMFRRVVYCSGGLYDVQRGYMLFRGVILDFSTPVVDIAASSWSLTWLDWLASWGCSLTLSRKFRWGFFFFL